MKNEGDIAIRGSEVYVADPRHRIVVFTTEGNFLRQWRMKGPGKGYFIWPTGIAISQQCVYVTELLHNSIQVFQLDGIFVRKWGRKGGGEGQFYIPNGIAVDATGNVYVIEKYGDPCRVQKFTAEGDFITEWPVPEAEYFDSPIDITIDANGNVYVLTNIPSVSKFSTDGKHLDQWRPEGSYFGARGGIIVAQGFIYTTSPWGSFPIQKFNLSGELLEKWRWAYRQGEQEGKQELFEIEEEMRVLPSKRIAIDSAGVLYLLNSYLVYKFSTEGEYLKLLKRWSVRAIEDPTAVPPKVKHFKEKRGLSF